MHQLLNDYFLNKEKEQNKLLEKEKEKLLLSEGLFEKVYSNTNNYDPEYPESEWDNYTQSVKYFKKVPIEITDNEYEQLKNFSKLEQKKETNNSVALALKIIAWIIMICGFISGIVLGNVEVTGGYYHTYTYTEFSLTIALTYWAVSLISGIFILGFSEIIKLLNAINNK